LAPQYDHQRRLLSKRHDSTKEAGRERKINAQLNVEAGQTFAAIAFLPVLH
jgi:hypothetical protein